MARRSFRQRARSAYGRTRTIVQRVYQRTRRRRTSQSFIRKNKTVLTVGVLAAAGWFFRDKIKAMFTK